MIYLECLSANVEFNLIPSLMSEVVPSKITSAGVQNVDDDSGACVILLAQKFRDHVYEIVHKDMLSSLDKAYRTIYR